MCSGDVVANVDHLYVKRIYLEPLVGHLYIVRENMEQVRGQIGCNLRGRAWHRRNRRIGRRYMSSRLVCLCCCCFMLYDSC
jgi:hypothetical protein